MLARFSPNPVQEKFLGSNKSVVALIAANKVGKTCAGAVWLLRHALEGGKSCKVVASLGFEKGVRDIILPEIRKWLPPGRILREKNSSMGITSKIYVKGDNGRESVISFMSGEQDDMAFEGDVSDCVWIDEPIRKSVYIACLRSLIVTSGPLAMTLTPLTDPWIYNDIYLSQDPEIECITGEIWDAATDKGGHLTAAQIDGFMSKIPAEEQEARIYGRFKHLVGRVYKAFDVDTHVVEPFKIPMSWPVWNASDPHARKPHASVWMAVSPDETWYICNEVWWQTGIEEFGKEVRFVSEQYNTVANLIDTSSETMDWNRRDTARSILAKVGLRTKLARKKNQKEASRFIIQQALEGKDEREKPWLYIFRSCKRTIFEFQNYVWDNHREPESQGIKEEPKKVNDDMLDCLSYIVVEKPRHTIPPVLTRSNYGQQD